MVVTRLLEVTTKGSEWVNSQTSSSTGTTASSSTGTTTANPSSSSMTNQQQQQQPMSVITENSKQPYQQLNQKEISSSSSYWNYIPTSTTSLQDMISNTISSMVSSLYGGGSENCAYYNSYHTNTKGLNDNTPYNEQNLSITNTKQQPSYLQSLFSFWNYNSNNNDSNHQSQYDNNNNDDYDYYNDPEEDNILYTTPRSSSEDDNKGRFHTKKYNHQRRRSSIFAFSTNMNYIHSNNNSNTNSSPWYRTTNTSNNKGNSSSTTTTTSLLYNDLIWMFRNNKNPYNAVRGHDDTQLSSLTAIRSLVALVATNNNNNNNTSLNYITDESENDSIQDGKDKPSLHTPDPVFPPPPPPPYDIIHDDSLLSSTKNNDDIYRHGTSGTAQQHPSSSLPYNHSNRTTTQKIGVSTPSETASQLAEGTIRALRDIALEEAVELQIALRYWNYRWERPLLSWIEAGPFVWTSKYGYNHQEIGRKVSQLQAVLARRCAAVGELQQHLLRAGWHRGVAQWGVLGQGGHWAPVTGFDGAMPDRDNVHEANVGENISSNEPFTPEVSLHKFPDSARVLLNDNATPADHDIPPLRSQLRETSSGIPPHVGGSNSLLREKQTTSQAHIFVGKKHGGGIYVDDPAFLAEWSVDAMKLIRKQLLRAGNGRIAIPFMNNWCDFANSRERDLPLWASVVSTNNFHTGTPSSDEDVIIPSIEQNRITITDIPLMTAEVSALLDIMEEVMDIQRFRRLEQLSAPSWIRSNWYIVATVAPTAAFILHRLASKSYGREVIKLFIERVASFFRERVVDPVAAIFNEVWRGRESFSDKKAREEAIESLKKMIRSWLDDTYPEMPESSRITMAESMDISLVERKKEESMKTFYEINNVIRMSFIEMQYMKKEMMNALHAIDEMMSANDINMNLAAITPAILLVYGSSRVFRFLFYALLKVGKSREETYASFRHILTDIERLLVMRDNPPNPTSSHYDRTGDQILAVVESSRPCVLCADDLGMLMLLIHECRSILYRDRRRFTQAIIRSVAEDLAELAGERGAVSVQQQLSIVARMCRTYPFLKVVSIGHTFQYEGLRHTLY